MRYPVDELFLLLTTALDISVDQRAILYVLIFAGELDESGRCYTDLSVGALADIMGISRRTIQVCLTELEELGYIRKDNNITESGYRLPDRKLINLDNIQEALARGMNYSLVNLLTPLMANNSGSPQNLHGCKICTEACSTYKHISNNIETDEVSNTISKPTNKLKSTTQESIIPIVNEGGEIPSLKRLPSTPDEKEPAISAEFDELSELFVTGEIKPEQKPTKSNKQGKFLKKIISEEYDSLTASDIVSYFTHLYEQKYHRAFSVVGSKRPQTIGIIKDSFLKKYGAKECIQILKLTFELYDQINPDKDYPRPSLTLLTQPWFVNMLYDEVVKRDKINQIRIERDNVTNTTECRGPHKPIELTKSQIRVLRENFFPYETISMALSGMFSKEWVLLLEQDVPKALNQVKEVLPQWMK
jgi:biotin operon repressor